MGLWVMKMGIIYNTMWNQYFDESVHVLYYSLFFWKFVSFFYFRLFHKIYLISLFIIFSIGLHIPLTHSYSHFILKLIYKNKTHIPLTFSTHFSLQFLKHCRIKVEQYLGTERLVFILTHTRMCHRNIRFEKCLLVSTMNALSITTPTMGHYSPISFW